MASIVDGLKLSVQTKIGVNLPAEPLNIGFRYRTDGAVAGEVTFKIIPASARGAYNAQTGAWS